MRVIAIINQKGGCGKTTTSINLSACLARLGQKTLLVDLDPQGHCAVGLAVPEEQIERSIFEALIEPHDGMTAKLSETAWQIAQDFDLSPSTLKLAAFEQIFAMRPNRENRLALALEQVRDRYAWVILDCPPSVGLITFNALKACDEVIVPVETGFFSLHGLTKMIQTLDVMKMQAGKDVRVRILPTLYDTRTKLAREVLSDLRAKFKAQLMESTVNFNTKLKEAASFGQPITEYDPGSRGYKDFINLARELMGEHRPEPEVTSNEPLTRPMELVQRAKALANLTNLQFGRNTVSVPDGQAKAAMVNGSLALMEGRLGMVEMGEEKVVSAAHRSRAVDTRTTDEKIADFYGVRRVNGSICFAARFERARSVQIAGDFNNWSAVSTPMVSDHQGRWSAALPLKAGRYQYRLVVDGQWVTDPHNTYVETNQFGELNNVVEVD
jgi:chromosome partitioning protein